MAASLGGELILDHDAGKTCSGKRFDSASDIRDIAMAGIAITDDRKSGRFDDRSTLVQHFSHTQKAGVRCGNPGSGHGKPAHESQLEPGTLDQPGRKPVIATGHDPAGICCQQGSKRLG